MDQSVVRGLRLLQVKVSQRWKQLEHREIVALNARPHDVLRREFALRERVCVVAEIRQLATYFPRPLQFQTFISDILPLEVDAIDLATLIEQSPPAELAERGDVLLPPLNTKHQDRPQRVFRQPGNGRDLRR